MKNLSRILTVLLCFAPVANASAAPVATTAGSNLTAFNPSNAYNNQWATLSNGRYDSANAPTAKADFGNCNALILRCAQPKCSNGGCTEASVAAAIVKGCVQSNKTCAQYGDDLVQYMTAQLVATSNAKVNEQNLAAQQAAAAAAQQQSEQQMQQMQYQMQQMQQQMAQQQAESAQQLQEALAQQAAQNAAALESMKSAATDAAKENEAGVSAYQQEAIDRGISADVIERQKITGQIMTEIENAEVSLKAVETAMRNAFNYAKCDARGNNCSGPKRVKKWRELATDFLTPYDNTIDKIYDALVIAQTVGVDLSQIYMMLNNSCNSWGQYMCPNMKDSEIVYTDVSDGQRGAPQVCPAGSNKVNCYNVCDYVRPDFRKNPTEQQIKDYEYCTNRCETQNNATKPCQPCTLLKVLTKEDEVYEGWVNAETGTGTGNKTVVACASGALDSSKLFTRRTKNKNGAGLVDIDKLDIWLNQVEPSKKYTGGPELINYCNAKENKSLLEKSALSKVVPTTGAALCVKNIGVTTEDKEGCAYISSTYAICDAHQYNAGISADDKLDSDKIAEMKEIIGLKTTVISQQMYKQYEYLNATLRRLKTQLEKAALTATLETAGAKSEDGSSSGGLAGGSSSKNSQYENCSGKDIQEAIYCLRQNYSSLAEQINRKKCNSSIKKQLVKDLKILDGKIPNSTNAVSYTKISVKCKDEKTVDCTDCIEEYSNGLNTLDDVRLDKEARRAGRYRD